MDERTSLRRVTVSRPVRRGHADSRLREHGVPGARSEPPRSVGERDGGAVLQRLHMVVCGWPILACVGDSYHHSHGPPEGSRLAHTGLTNETGWSHGVVHAVSLH